MPLRCFTAVLVIKNVLLGSCMRNLHTTQNVKPHIYCFFLFFDKRLGQFWAEIRQFKR